MNTSQLKSYAPRARKDFIAAVTAQAARIGITADNVNEAVVQGDVMLVAGQPFPKAMHEPRTRLVERVNAKGFAATMEAIAYTWFNRFMAIRYMELHGYLEHGYRVLSHPEGTERPEILEHATDVDLPGIDPDKVVDLKNELDGQVFQPLRDKALFEQVHVNPDTGTIEWPNGADFAPEFLYEIGKPVSDGRRVAEERSKYSATSDLGDLQ